MADGTVTIGLLGDVMLGRSVAESLADVPPETSWSGELSSLYASCDAVICNLSAACRHAAPAPALIDTPQCSQRGATTLIANSKQSNV